MKKSLDDQERAGKAAVSANVLTEVKEIMEKQGGKPEILVAELQALSNTKVLYMIIAFCIYVAPSGIFVGIQNRYQSINSLSGRANWTYNYALLLTLYNILIFKKLSGSNFFYRIIF